MLDQMTLPSEDLTLAFLVGGGAVALVLFFCGVWLGLRKTVIVYRNYYDIMLVGALYLLPMALLFLFWFMAETKEQGSKELNAWLLGVVLVLMGLLLVVVVIRTWRDNPNPLKMLLALYVKIPLGVFFFFHFLNIFDAKKVAARRKSFFWTLLLLPLLHGLVRDREGSMPRMPRASR